jgi:hypothetical protein
MRISSRSSSDMCSCRACNSAGDSSRMNSRRSCTGNTPSCCCAGRSSQSSNGSSAASSVRTDSCGAAAISAMYTARTSRILSRPASSRHDWFSAIAELNTRAVYDVSATTAGACCCESPPAARAAAASVSTRARVIRGAY